MSGVRAKLKVILQADDTVVAETEDADLWQRVLVAINKESGATDLSVHDDAAARRVAGAACESAHPAETERTDGGDEMQRFARSLGISAAVAQGACSPSKTSPYLTLDMHCWNAMKEQTPSRGLGSISPMAVSATLLALWMQAAKLGAASQAEAQKVLATIHLRDANAARSIQAAEWLQGRAGGVIVLNPARAKRAVAVAKAFCTQDWKSDLAWKGARSE